MTMPSPMHIFEAGLHGQPSSAPPSGNLDALLRQKMQLSIEMEAMSPDPAMPLQGQDPSSALNGVGDYLVRTASMWSRFTENLAVGDHVERAVGEAHIRAAHDTRFSDMSDIAALDIDLNKLRKIRDLTAKYSREVQAIWNPEPDSRNSLEAHMPISPFFDMKPLSIQHSLVPHTVDTKPQTWTSLSSAMNADSIIANDDDSGSDGSDEEDEELFQGVNLESLKSRGKGLHYCPKRYNCTKGGVDENNKLVAFVRNSAYLQHCNKHLKPWRCEKPYCPNPPKKRKFARRDGLERHQTSVSHKPPEARSPKMAKMTKDP